MARLQGRRFQSFYLHIEGVSIDNIALEDIGQSISDFADTSVREPSPRYSVSGGSLHDCRKSEGGE